MALDTSYTSLLANLGIESPRQVKQAIHAAILELNEDKELRNVIRKELLNSIRYAAILTDISGFEWYAPLWVECLGHHRQADSAYFREGASLANQLADELTHE